MKTIELLDVSCMEDADFDFEKCDKKDILSKMLEVSTPTPVKRFDSKGTRCDLWGEFYDDFMLYINGALLEASDLLGGFIEEFLLFLPQLAYTEDKKLICPFHYEGIITAFVTTPMEDDKIRVSVFKSGELYKKYRPENKFDADIVIKKDTFLKQIVEILAKIVEDTVKVSEKNNIWVNAISSTLEILNKYFDNPKNFKKNYDPVRHIRVFDIAYKSLNNTWKFLTAIDSAFEANPMYWERKKQQGKILDYDIFEQFPKRIYDWEDDYKNIRKLSEDEIKEKLKNDMDERVENDWVYSADTKKWYAPDEVMPFYDEKVLCNIHGNLSYDIKLDEHNYRNDDEQLEDFLDRSYDVDGELTEDNLGYLDCTMILINGTNKFAEINFDYRNYKKIREGLKKAEGGEYSRFDLNGHEQHKLHLWHEIYENSKTTESRDLCVSCYECSEKSNKNKPIYSFIVNKKEFINCFNKALDDIELKLKTTKHIIEVGEKLKIRDKFKIKRNYSNEIYYIEQFKGDYACVLPRKYSSWGIINKNMDWVITPEGETITGKIHPKYGVELKGSAVKYSYLHNVDGKLFIASRNNGEEFVMDINGDIQIPHVAEKMYYKYLNNELYFIAVDSDKTLFINSKGEVLLRLEFKIGEKFWLFDDIIIVSKDEKYGIVDWKGKTKIDFIFSDINPDKDSLDLIPVKYIDRWGFINKNGKVINTKIKGE